MRILRSRRAPWLLALALLAGCSDFREGPLATTCGSTIAGTCNAVTQIGCEPGSTCTIARATDGSITATCSLPGPIAFGDACDATHGCAAGLTCLSGQCRALCCTDDPAACTGGAIPAGAGCYVEIAGGLGVRACGIPCDWHAQSCANGGTCLPLDAAGTFADCFAPGLGVDGSPCDTQSDCARGFVCVGTDTSGACRAICTVGSGDCFPNVCAHITGTPPDFGRCAP